MMTKLKNLFPNYDLLWILGLSIVPVLFIWLPFILKLDQFWYLKIPDSNMLHIFRNWDGPNYIVVAKTWYDKVAIGRYLIAGYDSIYFTAHLPLYPLMIALFAPIFGWLYSGIIANIGFGIASNVLFYVVAKKYTKHALWLTAVFVLFPARFLLLRAIIAPETMLLFFMLLSLVAFERKWYWLAGIAGALACLVKVQAIFLFPAFVFALGEDLYKNRTINWRSLWVLVIPVAVLGLCLFYLNRTGDFLAFLHAQKGNNLALSLPFMQFNAANPWVNTGWTEDITFYIFGMFLLMGALYQAKERSWFYFAVFYGLFIMCIPQRDINRLAYPLLPLFLYRFEAFFNSKYTKFAIICLLPALYFYTLNLLLTNQAPVADWTNFIAR